MRPMPFGSTCTAGSSSRTIDHSRRGPEAPPAFSGLIEAPEAKARVVPRLVPAVPVNELHVGEGGLGEGVPLALPALVGGEIRVDRCEEGEVGVVCHAGPDARPVPEPRRNRKRAPPATPAACRSAWDTLRPAAAAPTLNG
jgi:hypothetical protein